MSQVLDAIGNPNGSSFHWKFVDLEDVENAKEIGTRVKGNTRVFNDAL